MSSQTGEIHAQRLAQTGKKHMLRWPPRRPSCAEIRREGCSAEILARFALKILSLFVLIGLKCSEPDWKIHINVDMSSVTGGLR